MSAAHEVIADILDDEFGKFSDEEACRIIEALTAAGFSIVHKDEIHAPSVERCARVADQKAFEWRSVWMADTACAVEEIAAALRELMKEVDR